MMNKEQLLAQLNDLHETMLEVDSREQKLDMKDWITNLSGTEDNRFCGTVACWLGWKALGTLENFPRAQAEMTRSNVMVSVAEYISDELDKSCFQVFGDSHLVESIYQGQLMGRWIAAKDSGLFSREESNHIHLTKDNPTPLEAASYALLCIEKVKVYEGQ